MQDQTLIFSHAYKVIIIDNFIEHIEIGTHSWYMDKAWTHSNLADYYTLNLLKDQFRKISMMDWFTSIWTMQEGIESITHGTLYLHTNQSHAKYSKLVSVSQFLVDMQDILKCVSKAIISKYGFNKTGEVKVLWEFLTTMTTYMKKIKHAPHFSLNMNLFDIACKLAHMYISKIKDIPYAIKNIFNININYWPNCFTKNQAIAAIIKLLSTRGYPIQAFNTSYISNANNNLPIGLDSALVEDIDYSSRTSHE